MQSRPLRDRHYLNIALVVAQRGTCLRRNYGAVIVNNDQIISTGYTGTPRGEPNCIDTGVCPRAEAGIAPGERYDLCVSVHAEQNAIIHAARRDMIGSTLYVAGFDMKTDQESKGTFPCYLCKRMIINAGIAKVVALEPGNNMTVYDVNDFIKEEEVDLSKVAGYGGENEEKNI